MGLFESAFAVGGLVGIVTRSSQVRNRLTVAMLACFLAAGWHCAGNHISEAAVRSHDDVAPASISDSLQNTKSDHKSPEYVTRNIEDLKPGDLVLAREEHGNSIEYKPIKKVFRRTSYHLRHLTFETKDGSQQKLETTDEHPFWSVTDRAWVDAGDLKPGSKVTSPDGNVQTLATTFRTEQPEGVPVFNFQVKDFHTYFVALESDNLPLLVHNADCLVDTLHDFSSGNSILGAPSVKLNPLTERARQVGDRMRSSDNTLEQLESIEAAKALVDKGKLKKPIDSIQKSKDRFKNTLRNIKNLDDLDDLEF